jgi:transposase
MVGMDMGIKNFAVFSNDEFIENPKFLLADEEKLMKAQSKRDKLPKGSAWNKLVQHSGHSNRNIYNMSIIFWRIQS